MQPHLRQPPVVVYPIRRSLYPLFLLVPLLLAAAVLLTAWSVVLGARAPFIVGGAWAFWGLACGAVAYLFLSQRVAQLHWEGDAWALEDLVQGRRALREPPHVLWGGQRQLWLQLRPLGGGVRWVWLEQQHTPHRWMDLRRAVYSRAKPGVDDAHANDPAAGRGL